MKIVTFGEIMLRLGAPDYLRLNQCNSLDVSYAGAEANVAVSLANYGVPVEYITALPDNPITSKCLDELRGKKLMSTMLYCVVKESEFFILKRAPSIDLRAFFMIAHILLLQN